MDGCRRDNDIHALVEQIIRDQITVLPAIPSMLRLIVEHPRFPECVHLRMLWTGGEAMPRELPQLVSLRTKAELWNLYGPTETAVEAIAARIESHDERCSVPLGYPIDGAEYTSSMMRCKLCLRRSQDRLLSQEKDSLVAI